MSFASLKVNSLQRFSLNFSANIIAAAWMLVGSVRAFVWVKPSLAQFVCFFITALFANVLFGWLAVDMDSAFNLQGLIAYLVWPLLLLLAGMILSKRVQNSVLLFIPALLWLAADTMLMLVQSLLQLMMVQDILPAWAERLAPKLFPLTLVWQTLALLLVFTKAQYWTRWERVLMALGVVALLMVWQKNVSSQPIFKRDIQLPSIDEEAFYRQPELLAGALSGVQQSDMGVSEWYFLGVAGSSHQNVFASEISAVRQMFDVRYGVAGRSLSLINNQHTWLDAPVATRSSIAAALKRIGEQMNAEEDVLFVALSSAGVINDEKIPTGALALDHPPLELADMDAAWLKDALDAGGIRWRVIVVSACYSGNFIDELTSPTTVVISASAADKPSFNCAGDVEMTHFGRAFYEESMRAQKSFVEVFNHAKRRVAEREALMGYAPSEPQMVVGSLMKTALPEFEKVLFEHGQAPIAVHHPDETN